MWEPQLALADLGWRVVAPQLDGVDGGTAAPVASMDDYAGEVVDLLDVLRIEDAVIGGLSMGGYVTLALFRHAPRYFRGMVLADTRPQAATPEGVEGRKRMLALVRGEAARARGGGAIRRKESKGGNGGGRSCARGARRRSPTRCCRSSCRTRRASPT